MYKHTTATPDWLYHEANLNFTALPEIQKELLKLLVITKKLSLVPYTSTYMEIGNDEWVEQYSQPCAKNYND